tara:strand:- start:148 stop:567 length:420 start_codon:yes stop_codon:yes gene_type:complete
MNYYEILYIVNPNLERKKIDDTMEKIESRLNKTKSKIVNHIIWGKKKLAYPIQGHNYGTYIMAHYNGGDKNALDEFSSWLKLSDLVIRHMIVRLDTEPDIIEKTENDLNLDSEKEQNEIKEKKINDNEKDTEEKTEGVE